MWYPDLDSGIESINGKIAEIQIKSGVYLIVMLVSFDKFTMEIQEAGLGANGTLYYFQICYSNLKWFQN